MQSRHLSIQGDTYICIWHSLLLPAPDPPDMTATPWFLRARLRTRHLMLLIAVGEGGNIHKAAQMMNMSQPAASRLLTDIENIIGTALFERLPRGVRANWYGEALIRHARVALASLSEAASEIDLLKSGKTGHVTVGSIEGPAAGFVTEAIAGVLRQHPLIRVQLQVQTNDDLLDALKDGKLDLMVGKLLGRADQSSFDYQCLGAEPVCAAARPNHPLLQRHDLALHDLADAPGRVPPVGTDLRKSFDVMFRDLGVSGPVQIMEAVSNLVIMRFLEETNHLALLPRAMAEFYAARKLVAILPIPLACKTDSYGIITRKDQLLSPSASLIHEAFAAGAGELKPDSAVDSRKRRVRDPERVLPPFASRVRQVGQNGEPVG
jgi:DNA-binding transcriptional LysR family regulator